MYFCLIYFIYFKLKTCKLLYLIINTFASQRLVFEEKNEPFFLENTSNLTYEFLNEDFNKEIQ